MTLAPELQLPSEPSPKAFPAPIHVEPRSRLALRGSDLVVVGDVAHATGVSHALDELVSAVHHVPSLEAALARGPERALAHVLVTPLPEAELTAAITRLRVAGPVFVVVPEEFSDARARRLYEAGTHAVFEWPGEALLLPRLVRRRLTLPARRRGPGKDADEALARSIRTRLELSRPLLPELTVSVDDGTAEVEGTIDSIWKKERVIQMVAHVPGVRAVLTEGIQVVPEQRADEAIEQDIRGVLQILLGDVERTVSFSVEDGAVVLVGNLSCREDMDRLLGFIGNVRGVKVLRNLVTVSPLASQRDRGLSERLNEALTRIYPDCGLSVVCFGPVAVVRGHVPRLSLKHEIEDLVAHQDGIERVVDKIDVVGSSEHAAPGS